MWAYSITASESVISTESASVKSSSTGLDARISVIFLPTRPPAPHIHIFCILYHPSMHINDYTFSINTHVVSANTRCSYVRRHRCRQFTAPKKPGHKIPGPFCIPHDRPSLKQLLKHRFLHLHTHRAFGPGATSTVPPPERWHSSIAFCRAAVLNWVLSFFNP